MADVDELVRVIREFANPMGVASTCTRTRCRMPSIAGDRRCLIHSADPDKDAAAFRRLVEKQLSEHDFDFSGYVFPPDFNFEYRRLGPEGDRPRVARGKEPVRSGMRFVGTMFLGHVNFYEANFAGYADFSEAVFERAPKFGRAQFDEGVNFHGVAFPAYTEFHNICFGPSTQFIRADLQYVVFRSVDLSECRFRYSRGLDKAEFYNVFWGWWPPAPWAKWPLPSEPVPLPNIEGFDEPTKADYPPPSWRSRLAIADELDARQGRGLGRGGTLIWTTDEDEKDEKKRLRERDKFLNASEQVYRALRTSYEARKDHPRVGDLYFAEMEVRRIASAPGELRQRFGSITAWHGLLSGYGERWGRALGCFAAVCLVWAALYLLVGLWIKTTIVTGEVASSAFRFAGIGPVPPGASEIDGTPIELYGHALLHSFLVSTLIGRDVYAQPVNALGQIIQIAESILGPLFLALMALGVRRRYERK